MTISVICLISDSGEQSYDPLALVGKSPHFSLSKLALYLSLPAVVGEFLPDCPWQGVTRIRSFITWPCVRTNIDEFTTRFQHSLSDCIENATTVGVALSGGLDSLAVLYQASQLCVSQEKKLIAVTADLLDDNGQGCATVARDTIQYLSISCDLHCVKGVVGVAQTKSQMLEATWRADGPRTDAMPNINRVMADKVEEEGADVLLTGSGADELLGSTRYLIPHLLYTNRWHDTSKYLYDLINGGGVRRLETEMLAILSSILPHSVSNTLYWATNWPELCSLQTPQLLAERFRPKVEQWVKEWLNCILTFHEENHRLWGVKDAWDAIFPLDVLPQAGNIPEREPFLQPSFMQYAMGLPLVERYSSKLLTPYHRRKALVLRLYPQSLHIRLPHTKQLFSRAFANYQRQIPTAQRCIDYGLVSKEALDTCTDASLLGMVGAIEHWIAGAEKRGAIAVE